MMRLTLMIAVGVGLVFGLSAQATSTLPFYESFPTNYGNGTFLGAGTTATIWDLGNTGTSLGAQITNTAALAYSGLAASDGFGLRIAGTPTSTRNRGASFTSQTLGVANPTLYASFLLNLESAPSAARLFAGFSSAASGTSISGVCGVWVNPLGQLQISKNSSSTPATTNTTALIAGTHLVVLSYQWNSGTGDDTVSLWLDPTSLGTNETSVPAPDLATAAGSDVSPLQSFVIFHPTTASVATTLNLDEIRVATNWAQVTVPGDIIPPPPQSIPVITQAFLATGALIMRGTNGPTNGFYRVLSSTDVVAPPESWASLATNQFDGSGNFDCTNPISLLESARLYRLVLGGSNAPVIVAPEIVTQPTNQTVFAGQNATFLAEASGTAPLTYQWFFNATNILVGETQPTLAITSAALADAGDYTLRVVNSAGSVTSAVATLSVNAAPVITTPPQSQIAVVSNNATFTVIASGSAPLHYQWLFNTNAVIANATNFSFTLHNVQTNDSGGYSVIVTNLFGAATSQVATLTVIAAPTNLPDFGLFGFGEATTGGGEIPETDPAYVKVYTPLDFATAIRSANKTAGSVKVIEIMNDLNLGWNEVGTDVQSLDSNPFRSHNSPQLHPVLIASGVSLIDIKSKSGLTIFSANGATIRHANFNIKDTSNIILRNLKFDEMWEWDEASKGNYDQNDWDFITIGNGGGTAFDIWIDHCTFTKAYDGICDMKGGCYNITFSWNKYVGDDGATNPNSFVRQQVNVLEANPSAYPMYNYLRTHGFSFENIVTICQGHDKTHLIGANSLDAQNAQHAVTFHHQWYQNPWDRLPRLRAGNVHNYNIYVDDTAGLAARRLRDSIATTLSSGDQNTLNNTYSFQVFLNGSISTEDGAVLVENSVYKDCLWPLRNNQTDPNDPTYTGKILALDSIYHFDNPNGSSADYRGSSTNAPGDTYFGPLQAPTIPFSWNGFTNLPYAYSMDDPAQVQSLVTAYAGAGTLAWAKTNWLKTIY